MSRDILIVGAGLFGSVIAERIASQLHMPVTVIDKRDHIGGNCWSEIDQVTGIECHKYGPHIFHTSNKDVWDYISQFTEWNNYQHHGWTKYKGKTYSIPINLQTINSYYNTNFTPEEAQKFIASEIKKEHIVTPNNLEEKAISLIGRPLYEAFIRGYTIKQWEKDPRELDASIITRLPVRYAYNGRYFNDRYEGIPLDGYYNMFEQMLFKSEINLQLKTDWFEIRNDVSPETLVIYTGPIDQFFNYKLGRLEWRTVEFQKEYYNVEDYQGASIINCADADLPYTRTAEYRHFHPERRTNDKTIVFREFSKFATDNDAPYYPILTEKNVRMYEKYVELAHNNHQIIFGGRLGTYHYFDMDDTIENAMNVFSKIKKIV